MMQSCMLVGPFRVSGQHIITTHGLMRWSKPQSKSLGVNGIYDAFHRVHDNSGTSVHPSQTISEAVSRGIVCEQELGDY